MWHNLIRFTSGAIILVSLSLFLVGCGGIAGDSKAPATNTVSGTVSDRTTGRGVSNAIVTAFAVDASGQVSGTALSMPATTRSDGWGGYSLNIPQSHSGPVLVQATVSGTTIRAILPSMLHNETLMLSLATEMAYQYILQNKAGVFSTNNIREANLMLERFFGQNFSQTPPPSLTNAATPAQQNLIVMIQAVNSLLSSGQTIADLVKIIPATGTVGLGSGATLTALNNAVAAAANALIADGTIPNTYTAPAITPLPQSTAQGSLADTTPPSAPTGLAAVATGSSTVFLTWDPALPSDGVTNYYIYRNGVFIASVASSPFNDTMLAASTTYTYQVLARDAAGNLSAARTVTVTTQPVPTYTISGKVTFKGTGLANVSLVLTGAGSGLTTTDANGNYSFTGVREGSYSITPALTGYLFAPASSIVYVATANVNVPDFIASQPGSVSGGTTYPDGSVTTTTTYPDGTVVTTTTYPNGTVIGNVNYPAGTIITTTTYPDGMLTTVTTYPNGSVTTATTFPNGVVTTATTYPNGAVIGGTTYPAGTIVTTTTYPNGTVATATNYPNGTVTTAITYANGMTTTTTTYATGIVGGGVTYPSVTVSFGLVY